MSDETTTAYGNTVFDDFCESGDHGKNGWRVPWHRELLQAYINGSYGNLTTNGLSFWSATRHSGSPIMHWHVSLAQGSSASASLHAESQHLLCVRPAP